MDNYFPPDENRDNLEDMIDMEDDCGRSGRRRGRRNYRDHTAAKMIDDEVAFHVNNADDPRFQ